MPQEPNGTSWLKYFCLSLALGIVIEILAWLGKVYFFRPWWLVFPVILGFWGGIFGSLAMLTRHRRFPVQYLPGFLLLFGAELLNHYYLHGWEFPGDSLYGITNPAARAAVLGIGSGFIIPFINTAMKPRGAGTLRRPYGPAVGDRTL